MNEVILVRPRPKGRKLREVSTTSLFCAHNMLIPTLWDRGLILLVLNKGLINHWLHVVWSDVCFENWPSVLWRMNSVGAWIMHQNRRCKRHGFDPWVRKIPWSRKWQPTPVFLPGESTWTEEPAGTVHGVTESWTRLMWLNTHMLFYYEMMAEWTR